MKTKSPFAFAILPFLSFALVLPPETWAEPQAPGQKAGEVSRLIPAVSIDRGSKKITASANSAVYWDDAVDTQVNARARIALEDGSVLNVGSESSIKVVKHDAGAQQTNLELAYGKLRSQAQKIAKPDGKFEVHTPAGVAGVVGTDFYIAYDLTTKTMNVQVFEGVVRVCNLAGLCVEVKAGQFTNVRSDSSSAPLAPSQASLESLTAAANETQVGGGGPTPGIAQAHHISKGVIIGTAIVVIVPAIVVPISSKGSSKNTPVPNNCVVNPQSCG